MRLTALFILALTLSAASSAVASAPIRTSQSSSGTYLYAPGELCSFGVLGEWLLSSDKTMFGDGSWVTHHVYDETLTNQATGGFITGHVTYNVMYDPADNTLKLRGLLYQVRDANGHVVSTSAGLMALEGGVIAKITPNAVPSNLVCASLAEAAP